jgi:very-short-patch-repair endonuclease
MGSGGRSLAHGLKRLLKHIDPVGRLIAAMLHQRYHPQERHYKDVPTGIERRVQAELTRRGIPFAVHTHVGPYVPDVSLPQFHAIIECDGDYWHSLPGRAEHDARRDRWFLRRGIRTIRIAEWRINSDCVGAIDEALRLLR